jgi:hypothetical protein
VSAGATCPEELELLLEDACLLSDMSLLSTLFDDDAVLLTRATSQVRGPTTSRVMRKRQPR